MKLRRARSSRVVRVVRSIGVLILLASCAAAHSTSSSVSKVVGESVGLTVRARTDVLVTGNRYQVVGDLRSSEDSDGTPTPAPRSP